MFLPQSEMPDCPVKIAFGSKGRRITFARDPETDVILISSDCEGIDIFSREKFAAIATLLLGQVCADADEKVLDA